MQQYDMGSGKERGIISITGYYLVEKLGRRSWESWVRGSKGKSPGEGNGVRESGEKAGKGDGSSGKEEVMVRRVKMARKGFLGRVLKGKKVNLVVKRSCV